MNFERTWRPYGAFLPLVMLGAAFAACGDAGNTGQGETGGAAISSASGGKTANPPPPVASGGRTPNPPPAASAADASASPGDDETDAGACGVVLASFQPPTGPAPASIVGTWRLDSVDYVVTEDAYFHHPVSRTQPILAITFNADGTASSTGCGIGMGDQYPACEEAFCSAPRCATSRYTYEDGVLTMDNDFVNGSVHHVYGTDAVISIPYFYEIFNNATLVRVDALPACSDAGQ
jgi:hypothetical protein